MGAHKDGPSFYDEEEVFETYRALRERGDNANATLEAPIFDELVGDVRGLRILDLGCGTARDGHAWLGQGAASYIGIEGSARMAEAARATLAGTAGEVREQRLEDLTAISRSFDLVTSRLALHYVADLDRMLATAVDALAPGGRIVISVEHPVITSCARGWTEAKRRDWIVDDYFTTGPRDTHWLGGQVRKHHRTVEDHFVALQRAGATVEALRESRPQRDRFTDPDEYARRARIPLFLFLVGRRVR